jgi:glycine dehydrogenase subunit 2
MSEPIIYELSAPGRCAVSLPEPDVPLSDLPPAHLLRDDLNLPEVSEVDLVRHYVHLSRMNYGVDVGMYPLGSCTMKYNPKVNEDAARLPGFAATHPYQPEETVQGNLQVMYSLQRFLMALSGFDGVSLQPAAGAHGELTGILMIRAYHAARGESQRNVILIPDSAHGTNPASTTMSGLQMVQIKSDARGNVDLDDLRAHLDEHLAGMMLTNPNTLGLFDEHILEITRLVHATGGLMYGDGANLNALMGVAKPADLGFDIMHFNLHKTFSTPHGGGGPGSGPVGARGQLVDFLPGPLVVAEDCYFDAVTGERWDEIADEEDFDDDLYDVDDEDINGNHDSDNGADADEETEDERLQRYVEEGVCVPGNWFRLAMPELSIGRVKAFYGHFGVMVRAYTYMRMLGAAGLKEATFGAVLNANYLQAILKEIYPLPYARTCMHEFVIQGKLADVPDVRALDIAKRLIDYGVHPPTNYFPLIVPEALMIEPTETESKRSLDAYADILLRIAQEARTNPQFLHDAPVNAPVGRLDEVAAARNLVLRWEAPEGQG